MEFDYCLSRQNHLIKKVLLNRVSCHNQIAKLWNNNIWQYIYVNISRSNATTRDGYTVRFSTNTLWQQNTEFLVNMIIFWQVNTKIWQADMNIWQVNIIILTSGLVADICHHISQIAFEKDSSLQSTFKFIDQWSETWNMLFNEN